MATLASSNHGLTSQVLKKVVLSLHSRSHPLLCLFFFSCVPALSLLCCELFIKAQSARLLLFLLFLYSPPSLGLFSNLFINIYSRSLLPTPLPILPFSTALLFFRLLLLLSSYSYPYFSVSASTPLSSSSFASLQSSRALHHADFRHLSESRPVLAWLIIGPPESLVMTNCRLFYCRNAFPHQYLLSRQLPGAKSPPSNLQ